MNCWLTASCRAMPTGPRPSCRVRAASGLSSPQPECQERRPTNKAMNETPNFNSPPRGGFILRLFSWRSLRRALMGLLEFVTLIGLLVTEEDWRGKHDWETYRHEQEAKGE